MYTHTHTHTICLSVYLLLFQLFDTPRASLLARLWHNSNTIQSRGIGKRTPRRGLSASLTRTIEAFCKLPDGQQRVTRGTRLRAYLGAHPRVNRLIPIPTLCLQLQRERRGLTSAPDTSVQANLRAARARDRATLC